jgi:hypothetical protein
MPKPTWTSWFMEDTLLPYVHYVPLNDDVSNLEDQYRWCLRNQRICETIADNGRLFITQFLDENKEMRIMDAVLTAYHNAVEFLHIEQVEENYIAFFNEVKRNRSRFVIPGMS